VAAAHNRSGGLMAIRNGVELPVAYLTLALTLAATGPGKYALGPRLPRGLAAVGAIGGAVAAGALIAKMVTSTSAIASSEPAPSEPVSAGPASAGRASAGPADAAEAEPAEG
jgi:hypothetical protein